MVCEVIVCERWCGRWCVTKLCAKLLRVKDGG